MGKLDLEEIINEDSPKAILTVELTALIATLKNIKKSMPTMNVDRINFDKRKKEITKGNQMNSLELK